MEPNAFPNRPVLGLSRHPKVSLHPADSRAAFPFGRKAARPAEASERRRAGERDRPCEPRNRGVGGVEIQPKDRDAIKHEPQNERTAHESGGVKHEAPVALPVPAPNRLKACREKIKRENSLGEKTGPRHWRCNARKGAWQRGQRGGPQKTERRASKAAMNLFPAPQRDRPRQKHKSGSAANHMQAENSGQALVDCRQLRWQSGKSSSRAKCGGANREGEQARASN